MTPGDPSGGTGASPPGRAPSAGADADAAAPGARVDGARRTGAPPSERPRETPGAADGAPGDDADDRTGEDAAERPGAHAGDGAGDHPGDHPSEDAAVERLLDERAGPLVRPYVMTRGRTRPVRGAFDLITMVAATGPPASPELGLGPEHQAVVRLCARPMSVAEIAGHLELPAVTVRVLLGDLLDQDLISVEEPRTEAELADDDDMYQAVIDGLHAL